MAHRHVSTSIVILAIAATCARAGDPHHAWDQTFGSSSSDHAVDIQVDGFGNTYVMGYFFDTIDCGGGPLVSAGFYDIYLAKYSPRGNHLWSKRIGGANSDYCNALSVDGLGYVAMAGYFSTETDLGGGVIPAIGFNDMFVARYDPNGTHVWSHGIGSTGADVATGVFINRFGSTVMVGYFEDSIQVGPDLHAGAGVQDLLVAKLDPAGNFLWSRSFGSTGVGRPEAVVCSSSGNIIFAADTGGEIDYGGGVLPVIGGGDIDLVQLDGDGLHVWSQRFGLSSTDNFFDLAIDEYDNVLMTGYFLGSTDLGGATLVSEGAADAFVAKYDATGSHLWSIRGGGPNPDLGRAVTAGAGGDVYLACMTAGPADFGGGTLSQFGADDWTVVRYTPNGDHVWSRGFGGSEGDSPRSIATDVWGNVLVAGDYQLAIDVGGGVRLSTGSDDPIFAKFHQAPDIHSIRDVPGDQGGLVNVAWDRCSADNSEDRTIDHYTVWRAIDAQGVQTLLEEGVRWFAEEPTHSSAPEGSPLLRAEGGYYWHEMSSVAAIGLDSYSAPVPTLFDSTGVSTELHYFQVTAHTYDPWSFYASPPDSGYSVDNLAPVTPQNLVAAASYPQSSLELRWSANGEADLAHYAVYRGAFPDFQPSADDLLAIVADTTATDVDWSMDAGYTYKVSALDVHGNESGWAVLQPGQVTSTGEGPPSRAASLHQNHPNPFNPTTTIHFALSERGPVRLTVFDAKGRRVRVLLDAELPAGSHQVRWEGTDASGTRVASGIYHYQLESKGLTLSRGMALVK